MDAVSTQTRVRTCSECQGDAEYFCKSHGCDICTDCSVENEIRSNNLEPKYHDLIVYRNKLCINLYQEICKRHPRSVYENFCEFCELPICSLCKGHETHKQSDIKTGPKRYCDGDDIHLMKKILLYLLITQPINCQKFGILNFKVSQIRTNISKKANEQKSRVDSIVKNLAVKHSCPKMKKKIKEHLVRIQKYENFVEYSAIKPVHFLLHKKKIAVPKKRLALHTSNVYMTESFDKEHVMESFDAIRITEREQKTLNLNELELLKYFSKINRYPNQLTNILLDSPFLEFTAVGLRQLSGFDILRKLLPIKPHLLDLCKKAFPEEIKDILPMDVSSVEPGMTQMLEMFSKKDFKDQLLRILKTISGKKSKKKPMPFSEKDQKMFHEIRNMLQSMPYLLNLFGPVMSQTITEMLNLVDPPENMEA